MAEFSVVGKSISRVDALEKVTGKAKFTADFKMPGMLYLKVLRSPYPHARIVSIDASKAQNLPGVRAVLTGKEAPDELTGMMLIDQYPIARDVVRFVGEVVAVVAADRIEIAEDALQLIDVNYEELPAVFDVEEAIKPDCPVIIHPGRLKYSGIPFGGIQPRPDPQRPNVFHSWRIRQGDVDRAFQEADLIVENRYSTCKIHHGHPETYRADAWVEPDGTVTIRSKKQGIYQFRNTILRYLGLSDSKIRQLEPYIGGTYGGGASITEDCIAGLMAIKTGRPVRLVLTREEQIASCYSRVASITYIKDGVKTDGSLLAREMKVIFDGGGYSNITPMIVRNSAFGAVGIYRVPNFKWNSYGVYTNKHTAGPFRGLAAEQVAWAIEQQMDIIAEKLSIDPVELRRKNILREGDKNSMGEITHSIGVRECLDKVAEAIEWGEPTAASAGPWRRGKAVCLGNKYTSGAWTVCIVVKIHPDNVIEVRSAVTEMGQGANTVITQIVAEAFGISPNDVKVVFGDTAISPYTTNTGSSMATFHAGNAALRACEDAKRQIFEIAATKLGVNPAVLETGDWEVYTKDSHEKSIRISDLFSPPGWFVPKLGELIGKGEYTSPYVMEDQDGQSPRTCSYYGGYVAYGVEVAVNIETGQVKVERVAGAFDMGYPINPKMCEQQMEGGMAQGIGGALYEEILEDRGRVLNPNYIDYKISTTLDLPSGVNVKFMVAPAPHKEGPYGAKGFSEGAMIPMPPAIANAVYNAIGVRIRDLPISREKIWNALKGIGKT